MIQKFFDLQGASLRVSAIQPVLVDFYGRIFAGRSRPLPTAPLAYGLTITSGEPLAMPEGTEALYTGPVLDEGEASFWQGPEGRILAFPGIISLTLSDRAREATIIVAPGAEERITMTCGQLALQAALLAARQFLIHAAGLTLPDGRVALIFGRSGAGKTTSTLALAAGGLGLCSDDAMACNVSGERPTAWGMPRNLKVHRRTAEMLPWVQPLLSGDWSAEDERPVTLAALRTTVSVESITAREIAAIFVLERSGAVASRCEPVSKAEVLALAAADNVRSTRIGVPESERELFKRLGDLVRALPTYRLSAGSDPTDLAPVLLAALGIRKIVA
ncbi:MAG TPA: hypothetical protein VGV07_04115 [Devosia sp.]|uniref:hypothetical protein n=1 Tax=Devosia sp. TaxID=1871048 RepID=UPI002DDD1911|nr:hypothetical protein [Devosia sp.]HEV2514410.1 hypothetical protein [Devosia sp.]